MIPETHSIAAIRLLESGPVEITALSGGQTWARALSPAEGAEGIPSPWREQVEAHWAEGIGTGETRAERWHRLQAEAEGPPPSLEERRAGRLAELAHHRWQLQSAGVEVEAVIWHSDHEGRQAIHEALTLAQLYEAEHGPGSWSMTWKAQSGFTSATLPLLFQVGQAIGAYVAACFAREQVLAAEIVAAEEPEAVDITTGWPGV